MKTKKKAKKIKKSNLIDELEKALKNAKIKYSRDAFIETDPAEGLKWIQIEFISKKKVKYELEIEFDGETHELTQIGLFKTKPEYGMPKSITIVPKIKL